MGISRLTCLEIFTNPTDLQIMIGQEKNNGKYAIGIFRGPGHNFKPLITSGFVIESFKEAIEEIKKILESIHYTIESELKKKGSLLSSYLNPSDQSKTLNLDLISRILKRLRQHREVDTAEM